MRGGRERGRRRGAPTQRTHATTFVPFATWLACSTAARLATTKSLSKAPVDPSTYSKAGVPRSFSTPLAWSSTPRLKGSLTCGSMGPPAMPLASTSPPLMAVSRCCMSPTASNLATFRASARAGLTLASGSYTAPPSRRKPSSRVTPLSATGMASQCCTASAFCQSYCGDPLFSTGLPPSSFSHHCGCARKSAYWGSALL